MLRHSSSTMVPWCRRHDHSKIGVVPESPATRSLLDFRPPEESPAGKTGVRDGLPTNRPSPGNSAGPSQIHPHKRC